MERHDRKYRDESQGEAGEIAHNIIGPDSSDDDSVYQHRLTLSSSFFPEDIEGRDGDRKSVVTGGDTWMCEKVRGKWNKIKIGSVIKDDVVEVTAEHVADKVFDEADTIGEAPSDDSQYGRKNEDWEEIEVFDEAPIDGVQYARKDGAWDEVDMDVVEEAPIDGSPYARKDGAWDEIIASEVLDVDDVHIDGGTLPDAVVTIDGGILT